MNTISFTRSDNVLDVLLHFFLLCSVFGMTSIAHASSAQKVSSTYLNSIATDDFKSLFSVDSTYQYEIADIRNSNPKVLWKRLESEHYEKAKADYKLKGGLNWLDVPYWKAVLRTGSVSAIEEKNKSGIYMKTGRDIIYTTVYYRYIAKDPMSSIRRKGKKIKEFIFSIDVISGKVNNIGTIESSYVYFPLPEFNKTLARDAIAKKHDKSLPRITFKKTVAIRPNKLIPSLANDCIRAAEKNGIIVSNIRRNEGRWELTKADMVFPDAWNDYLVEVGDSRATYHGSLHIDIQIEKVESDDKDVPRRIVYYTYSWEKSPVTQFVYDLPEEKYWEFVPYAPSGDFFTNKQWSKTKSDDHTFYLNSKEEWELR